MRVLLTVLLSFSFLFAAPFHIVTSFYPLQIMAINVAKDIPSVSVENLTPPLTGCLHDFSLTPKQLQSLSRASVLVVNGLGMESFLDKVIRLYPKLPIIVLTQGLPVLISDGQPNPHVWLSVPLAKRMVDHLSDQLGQLDAIHRDNYKRNAILYEGQLQALDVWMKKELSPYHGISVITFHDAFPYFAKEYGFNVAGVIEREAGSEPSAKDRVGLRKKIVDEKVRVVFAEPQYSDKIARSIIRGSTTQLAELDPGVTGPVKDSAYLDMMRHNIESIRKALKP